MALTTRCPPTSSNATSVARRQQDVLHRAGHRRLRPYKTTLDDDPGDSAPAQAIFAPYKQRVDQRSAYARSLLKQDIFHFDGNDRWYYDREKSPWASSQGTGHAVEAVGDERLAAAQARGPEAGPDPQDPDKRYANLAKSAADLNGEDAFQSFLNAYTNAIDPHTDYFNPRTAERFNQQMSLSLEGIGAVLQKQDDVVVVREIVPGGPAALSKKLQPGDRIVAVGQGSSGPMEDVVGWRIDDVVEKIKGAKGTQVRLDIIPPQAGLDSKPNLLQLTRARIRLEEQAAKSSSSICRPPAACRAPHRRDRVAGVLPGTSKAARPERRLRLGHARRGQAAAQFKTENVDGVVIDLRNNGGGSLDEAVNHRPVHRQGPGGAGARIQRPGQRRWRRQRQRGLGRPLAVLVNRGSASPRRSSPSARSRTTAAA